MTFIYRKAPSARCTIGSRELHCGDCFQILVQGKWHAVRIEMSEDWYLVGMEPMTASLYNYCETRTDGTPDVPFPKPHDPRPRYERIHKSAMHYTDATDLVILHEVKMFEGRVLVVGNPWNGAYEWVIEHEGKGVQNSDSGYGDSSVAMRDGLIVWHGEMESVVGKLFVSVSEESSRPDRIWLVWSLEHRAWWKENGLGYTENRNEAGRFNYTQALDIVREANRTIRHEPMEALVLEHFTCSPAPQTKVSVV